MLSFYLAFIYADKPYFSKNRLLCMSEYLFKVQARNRLQQKGLLKRFSITCYGEQKTLETMRAEKSEIYKRVGNDKNSQEYQNYFLRYIPSSIREKPSKKNTSRKSNTRRKSTTIKKSKTRRKSRKKRN